MEYEKKCAVWCGAGCTQEAYDRAVREAADLAEIMNEGLDDSAWCPNVWENMGWYYSVNNGDYSISPGTRFSHIIPNWEIDGYWCYYKRGGFKSTRGDTPQEALGKMVEQVLDEVAKLEEIKNIALNMQKKLDS